MNILSVKRKSKFENIYSPKMGRLVAKITSVKLFLFGLISIKTLHKYRNTYYGEVKDVKDCNLNK